MEQYFILQSWPRAILHIDCDAFFASCEQAVHPEYRGKPVITGKERGIVAAASYEAKRLGIKRGIKLWDVKKICPEAIIVPSDYETYSLFSKRMFAIIRRFTPMVEEYSIDEAFADITGFRRAYHSSYAEIAKKIKETIERELGITVSVGLSISKVLAKIASDFQKPSGLTIIPGRTIEAFLKKIPIGEVWGIGPQTASYCLAHGMATAFDFASKDEDYIRERFTKPHHEIWRELRGEAIYHVHPDDKSSYMSIGKTKTFTPPSSERAYVYAQLFKNIENACIKARRYSLGASGLVIYLKTQDFQTHGMKTKLNRATAFPNDIAQVAAEIFRQIYRPHTLYRATGVVLLDLQVNSAVQTSLFESPLKIEKLERVFQAVDAVAERIGKHTLHLGGSLLAHTRKQHLYDRGDIPVRKVHRNKGEDFRKHLSIPMLGVPPL